MVKVGVRLGGTLVGVRVGIEAQMFSLQPLEQSFAKSQHSPSQRYCLLRLHLKLPSIVQAPLGQFMGVGVGGLGVLVGTTLQ